MLSSRIITVLAAFYGLDLAQGSMLKMVFDEMKVNYYDDDLMGEWIPVVNKKNSDSIIDVDITVKKDLPPDLMIKFECEISGSPMPPYEESLCTLMDNEVVGKSIFETIKPDLKNCPIKGGKYTIVKFDPSKINLPDGAPDGEIKGTASIEKPGVGGKPCMTIEFKGNLIRNLPGKR